MVLQAFQDCLATGQGLTTSVPCRGHQHDGITHRQGATAILEEIFAAVCPEA